MARAKKVDDGVEAVAKPEVEKKTRTRKKVEEPVVETVEVQATEVAAPVVEKVEEPVVVEEVKEVVVEDTPVAPVETEQEVIEATTTVEAEATDVAEETVIPEGFQPILRPTSVGGKPLGYIGCPKQVFDIVTRKGWRHGIEKHKYRTQLMSILYWYRKNGEAQVRCNSSSKFAKVSD